MSNPILQHRQYCTAFCPVTDVAARVCDIDLCIMQIHAAVDSRFLEGLLSGTVALPLTDKVDMAQPVRRTPDIVVITICTDSASSDVCSRPAICALLGMLLLTADTDHQCTQTYKLQQLLLRASNTSGCCLGLLLLQVPCRAGCGDEYCSVECETQAWDNHHCMLCTIGADDTAATSSTATSNRRWALQWSATAELVHLLPLAPLKRNIVDVVGLSDQLLHRIRHLHMPSVSSQPRCVVSAVLPFAQL